MLRNGWCPHQIANVQASYDERTVSFLATIKRSGFRDRDHLECRHTSRCVANNIDMTSYESKHCNPACRCDFIGGVYEKIVEIISEGGVPLIAMKTEKETGQLHLHIERRTPKSRYVAISHVWSDGLGNPKANTLPQCQLRQLAIRLTALSQYEKPRLALCGFKGLLIDWRRWHFSCFDPTAPPLFWMDTLCIPVKEEHASLRCRSINQMASVYAAATRVLVLDAELFQISTRSVFVEEVLLGYFSVLG